MSTALRLRVLIDAPPPGVMVALQRGKGSAGVPDGVQKTDGIQTTFELTIEVKEGTNGIKFAGPYVQQDSKGQFVYLCWGQAAGDFKSCWQRRTKIYLHPLTDEHVRSAIASGNALTLAIGGTAKDGGPACATVPVRLVEP